MHTEDEAKPRKSKKLKIFIAVLVVLAAFGAAVILAMPKIKDTSINHAVKISDQAVNSMQNKDSTTLYSLATDSFKKATSMEQLNELLATAAPELQGEEQVFAQKILSNNGISVAAIVYNIPTSNGTRYARIVLQKEGETWKVINFRYADTPLDTTIE